MFIRALILSLAASSANAMSIDFTPKIAVWDCPQGFEYPVLQCVEQETVFPPQHLEFMDAGNGFYISDWSGSAPGVLPGYSAISFMIYPREGVVRLMANMSAGFDPNEKRNPGAFFESIPPEKFPDWFLITGEKRTNGDREALVTFEYADLKYTP